MSLTIINRCPQCGNEFGNKLVCASIEAEATKSKSAAECAVGPCDCDPHIETCEKCAPYLHEAKPQEPVAWVEVVDRHEGPYNFHGKELLDSGKHNLYTTPQPCPECTKWGEAWDKLNEDTGSKIAELERVNDICKMIADELPKTIGYVNQKLLVADLQEAYDLINKGRIAELEAERDDWKSRYESNMSVNQMHSDNNAEMLKYAAVLRKCAATIPSDKAREAFLLFADELEKS